MTSYLLDANVLIAWTTADHVHHDRVWSWFEQVMNADAELATCPITEGALVRHQVREGARATSAARHLDLLHRNTWHVFWPDDLPYTAATLTGVSGHRHVTAAYLVALADHHAGRLVTLDVGLASAHPHVVLIGP